MHAGCDDRVGLCGPRVGGLLCRFRAHGVLRRKDPKKIEALNRGEMPIFEPGLPNSWPERARGPASFATSSRNQCATPRRCSSPSARPSRRGDGFADLSMCTRRTRDPPPGRYTVVTKSTVPVGTGDEVERIIGTRPGPPSRWCRTRSSCARRGDCRLQAPVRIVIGSGRARQGRMGELYGRSTSTRPDAVHLAPHGGADEYAANAFRATNITFINEIADLCEKVGAPTSRRSARHRPRQPHRLEVPACRPVLRRLVLPEDTLARSDRAGLRGADPHRRDGRP